MNIMRNAFKRANCVLCLLLALSGTSCINRLNDEIKEGSILISFSFETSKAATKVTKNTFDIGDRSGIFVWGIERSVFFNGWEKWAKGFENQRV